MRVGNAGTFARLISLQVLLRKLRILEFFLHRQIRGPRRHAICMIARARVRDDKKRILVVEDDADIIKVHQELLSDRFTVIVKTSGMRAISYLRE